MSDHPPFPRHICNECGKPIVEVDGSWWHHLRDTEPRLSRAEWEATIDRCEHGKIDRHIITDYDGQGVHRDDMKWCPGAAVKGAEDE